MEHSSPLRVLIVSALILGGVGFWLLPGLKEARLVGMAETRSDVITAVAFAKEYALLTGVNFAELDNEQAYYEAIRPFIQVYGLKGPTRTELLQLSGLSVKVGPPAAPVTGEAVSVLP